MDDEGPSGQREASLLAASGTGLLEQLMQQHSHDRDTEQGPGRWGEEAGGKPGDGREAGAKLHAAERATHGLMVGAADVIYDAAVGGMVVDHGRLLRRLGRLGRAAGVEGAGSVEGEGGGGGGGGGERKLLQLQRSTRRYVLRPV